MRSSYSREENPSCIALSPTSREDVEDEKLLSIKEETRNPNGTEGRTAPDSQGGGVCETSAPEAWRRKLPVPKNR